MADAFAFAFEGYFQFVTLLCPASLISGSDRSLKLRERISRSKAIRGRIELEQAPDRSSIKSHRRLPTAKEIIQAPGAYVRQIRSGARERLRDSETRIVTAVILGAAALVSVGLLFWILLVSELPSVQELRDSRVAEASVVYAADGQELARYHDKNRTWVGLDKISPQVVYALIATEDHRFYKHWGIDLRRTMGSLLRTLGGDTQGGSTITMQFARNAYPSVGDDLPLTRKVKEWITAMRIEGMYTKEEILEMYLNTVPFMYNTFGIEAAAQTYFQKQAADLTLLESATMVGMLKGTVLYNPVRNPENSQERRNVVMQQMVKNGYLQEAEYERLRERETPLNFRVVTSDRNRAPYFVEYLRQWIGDWTEREGYDLYTGGLRIYTTIDSRMQEAAETAVIEVMEDLQAVADVEWSRSRSPYFSSTAGSYRSHREKITPFAYFWESKPQVLEVFIKNTDRYKAAEDSLGEERALEQLRGDSAFLDSLKTVHQRVKAGFVAIEPQTGQVRAWVGGRDFTKDKYDHVAFAKRQPGSTFKPFVYAAAIDNGYSPEDLLRDEVIEYVDPQTHRRWRPTNVGSATGQLISLRDALAHSKNTVTAQVITKVGPDKVARYARRMGIESELVETPSLGLGTSEVSLLEMASAYGTLANQGRHAMPVFVTRIEDRNGKVLASFTTEATEVLPVHTAYTIVDMMRGVVDYGTGRRIRSFASGDLAGKTGTTQGGADGWFLLMHPNLVMGCWVGFDSPSVTFRSDYWGQGAHNALLVVGRFFQDAGLQNASFTAPPGYNPPPPRQASELYALADSTDRETKDSLTLAMDSTSISDTTALDPGIEVAADAGASNTSIPDERLTAEESGLEEEKIEGQAAVDSLNMQEREDGQVQDYLRRLREKN